MIKRFQILPLDADESSRFLPWTIAFMTYLASLALAGGLALAAVTARFDPGETRNLTVEIPPPLATDNSAAEQGPKARQARVAAALDLLRNTPGIIAAEAMERREIAALLEPWLGKTASLEDLPLPDIIDITVDRSAEIDTQGLGTRLAVAVPGATLDDHGLWFARITSFVHSTQLVAAVIVLLTCAAAVFTVVFVTRSSLAVHRDIIEMLHVIGAEDGYIAREFQNHALPLGLSGAVPGLLAAVLTIELLGLAASRVDAALLPDIHLSAKAWVVLALVPVVAGLIAMMTARATVMRRLSRMI